MRKYLPINRILLTLLLFTAIIIIVFTYLHAFEANPPIVFNNIPFPVNKETYKAGDLIIATVDYCKYTDVGYTKYSSFVDGIMFAIPEEHKGGSPPGCRTVNTVSTAIPENLPPGVYYLQGRSEYRVNFLATRIVDWSTEKFEVIP